MKTRELMSGWEVEWCNYIERDRDGIDPDSARYCTKDFDTKERALAYAEKVLPYDQFGSVLTPEIPASNGQAFASSNGYLPIALQPRQRHDCETLSSGADDSSRARYKTIVADPPWRPSLHADNPRRATLDKAGPQKHYPTMLVEEIERMAPFSEEQSHLWLWVLNQHVDWGWRVARAWGFEPQQMLTWCKPGLGAGRFQCNSEQVLICRKGKREGNPFGMTGGTWFQWPRGRHSAKPDEFFALVEKCSPAPYLEMFARRRRVGWSAFGNEVESDLFTTAGQQEHNRAGI